MTNRSSIEETRRILFVRVDVMWEFSSMSLLNIQVDNEVSNIQNWAPYSYSSLQVCHILCSKCLLQLVIFALACPSLGAPQDAGATTPVHIISQNSVVNADGSFNHRWADGTVSPNPQTTAGVQSQRLDLYLGLWGMKSHSQEGPLWWTAHEVGFASSSSKLSSASCHYSDAS
jgi:hypothetical protein